MQNTARKIYIDLETTGVEPSKDRICQIAIIKVDGSEYSSLVNPERVIPDEASKIHGITNVMVKDSPKFGEIAERVRDMLLEADHFVAYNSIFDFQFLQTELNRSIGFDLNEANYVFVDPYKIFRKMFPHNLANAYLYYTGKTLENAHNAIVDIRATREVLDSQEARYTELFSQGYKSVAEETIGDTSILGKWFERREEGALYFKQGKHKGEKISQVHADYLRWISRLDDISVSERRQIASLLQNH